MDLEWRDSGGRHIHGEHLFLNGIHIGGFYWARSTDPKGTDFPPYAISTRLPGFKLEGRYKDEHEARKRLEAFTRNWLERMTGVPLK